MHMKWVMGTLSLKNDSFIKSTKLACPLLWRETLSISSKLGRYTNIMKRKSRIKGVNASAGKTCYKMKDPWRTVNTYKPPVHQV